MHKKEVSLISTVLTSRSDGYIDLKISMLTDGMAEQSSVHSPYQANYQILLLVVRQDPWTVVCSLLIS